MIWGQKFKENPHALVESPSPKDGDLRSLRKYAYWPKKLSDGRKVWLETYISIQRYQRAYRVVEVQDSGFIIAYRTIIRRYVFGWDEIESTM